MIPGSTAGTVPIFEIQRIMQSIAWAGGDAHVLLAGDGVRITTRSGRLARWIGNLQTSANRRTTQRFMESMRARFGPEVTDRLAGVFDMHGAAESGRPLLARRIRALVGRAEQLAIPAAPAPARILQPPARPLSSVAAELAREMQKSLDVKYVNGFVLEGNPLCPDPMPQTAFLKVLKAYNGVMEYLHARFPGLRDIQPPNLSENSMGNRFPGHTGYYNAETSTLEFNDYDRVSWLGLSEDLRKQSAGAPNMPGFEGIVLHEYAHHLSSAKHSDQQQWLSRLATMLNDNGFISGESSIDTTSIHSPTFTRHVGRQTREMGLGTYAGNNAAEFVAEALAWRMAPGYGESSLIPRMPGYLENWVHECFPFTCAGPIPTQSVAFDPARIHDPAMVDGFLTWKERGSLSASVSEEEHPPRPAPRRE